MNETSNQLTCSFCGGALTEETAREFGGRILCENCYESNTVVCARCGDRIWDSDSRGDEDTPLCIDCHDDHYTHCEDCDRLISNEDAYYEDDSSEYAYCERCYNRRINAPIKSYYYKPEPQFYGSGDFFMGVELEIDNGGECGENAEKILNIANANGERIYCKHDGSIQDGFEMVSHPMSLEYHTKHMNWKEVFDKAVDMGYRSHQTYTCGLHAHVSRNALGNTYIEQEATIARIIHFVELHWNELLKFSRRTEESITRWANRYGIAENTEETYKKAKNRHLGRYVAVNLENVNTVEFRMFKGTLRYETFIATLQLIHEICRLAISLEDKEMERLSWSDFVLMIDAKHQELIDYLKTKRLYVNEIQSEREDA